MRTSWTLGRIRGIEIGINWSVLALLALLMWTLASGVFPSTNPGLGDNAYFVMAVVASLGFFASILLHELGHAFEARREGMTIDGITLWLFGGVARFQGMFPTAGAEFRIAVAGPLVSLALGVAFVGGALAGLPEALDAICAWLAWINLALLVFNLLPALPLDGGRMLRAALWQWKGDLAGATRLAAGGGRVLSLAMIGGGVVLTVLTGQITGLWLAFIGWFLLQAAGAEARYVNSPLRTLRVRDMMVADPVTVSPAQTLADVSDEILWRSRHAAYPVVRDGVAVGLLTARSLEDVDRPGWAYARVSDHMDPIDAVPAVAPDDGLPAAVEALRNATERALVVEGGRLVGLLAIDDVARAIGVESPSLRA